MKAISFQDDIIIAAGEGAVPGIEMPAGVPRGRLRYDGNALIDIEAVGQFFIDELGTKHILQTDPAWQLLVCAWDED